MKRYTYRSRTTGKKVQSDKPLPSKDYALVTAIHDGQMKAARIRQK